PQQPRGLMARLAEAGLVASRPRTQTRDERGETYWEANGVDAAVAAEAVAGRRLGLVTVGDVDSSAALDALRAAGLAVTPGGTDSAPDADLSILLCDDYLAPALTRVDSAHRTAEPPRPPPA